MDQILNPEIKLDESGVKPPRLFSVDEIRCELQTILASKTFRAALGQKKFLAFAVGEVLAGRPHLLKEYVIATEGLGRDVAFDPRLDPIVRTEARKLRARLAKYYELEGCGDLLRIEFHKGSYVPSFHDPIRTLAEPPGIATITEAPAPPTAVESPSISNAPVHSNQFRWRTLIGSLAVVGLVAASIVIFYRLAHSGSPGTIFAADDAPIAVLPLVNLSNSNSEFLSEGLTEELINSLRQVPGLQVVARTSAFRFKGKTPDLHQIDRKLHVRAVLVGSVNKYDNRLRVTVQLNNAGNGYHLWSGSYERDAANIGTILPEIASAVGNALGVGLVRGSQALIQTPPSPNSAAHEDYLKGLYFRNRFTIESLNRAIEYFKQAIQEDPSFAQAYAGLADCYALARPVASTPPLEIIPKIKAAASKAIELDASLGEPHVALAVAAEYEYDWDLAEKEFKKGLELTPGDAVGHIWYAWYLALHGRKEEVLAQKAIAAKLDPVSPYAVESVGRYYSAIGRYDTAVEQYRNALALEPNFGLAHQDLGDAYLSKGMCREGIDELRLANASMPGARRMALLGYGYAVCGHTTEARQILREFLKEPRHGVIPALAIAEVYLGLGDKERAFPWLEKAIDERDLEVSLKWDARFEPLRSDPRYSGLLRRMKLD
jgi:TolB-like protein/Tfp pilus assembly protein PilF